MILPKSPAVIPMVIASVFVVAEAEMKLVCRYQLERGPLLFIYGNPPLWWVVFRGQPDAHITS